MSSKGGPDAARLRVKVCTLRPSMSDYLQSGLLPIEDRPFLVQRGFPKASASRLSVRGLAHDRLLPQEDVGAISLDIEATRSPRRDCGFGRATRKQLRLGCPTGATSSRECHHR